MICGEADIPLMIEDVARFQVVVNDFLVAAVEKLQPTDASKQNQSTINKSAHEILFGQGEVSKCREPEYLRDDISGLLLWQRVVGLEVGVQVLTLAELQHGGERVVVDGEHLIQQKQDNDSRHQW